jgi:hypothetical protein
MALPSGVYIIENVQNHNWAILTNDNDGDDVVSGTDADPNVGHKVECLFISHLQLSLNYIFHAVGGQEVP